MNTSPSVKYYLVLDPGARCLRIPFASSLKALKGKLSWFRFRKIGGYFLYIRTGFLPPAIQLLKSLFLLAQRSRIILKYGGGLLITKGFWIRFLCISNLSN